MIWCSIWTSNNCYWDKEIPNLSMMRAMLIEDTKPTLPPVWAPKVRNLGIRDPRVEGTLYNRVLPYMSLDHRELPISVTHKVGVVAHPIMVLTKYTLVGIIPISRAYWEYHSSSGQQVEGMLGGVQPKTIMMHVFYHLTILGHQWEDQ